MRCMRPSRPSWPGCAASGGPAPWQPARRRRCPMAWAHDTGHLPAYRHTGDVVSVLADGTDTSITSAAVQPRVVGWRAACECGWRGQQLYPRAEWPSPTAGPPELVDGRDTGGGASPNGMSISVAYCRTWQCTPVPQRPLCGTVLGPDRSGSRDERRTPWRPLADGVQRSRPAQTIQGEAPLRPGSRNSSCARPPTPTPELSVTRQARIAQPQATVNTGCRK